MGSFKRIVISASRDLLGPAFDRLYGFRVPIQVALQIVLIVVANQSAFWLRFEGTVPPDQQPYDREVLPLLIALRLAAFVPFRLYQGIWRYASIWDLRNIVAAVGASSVLFWAIAHGVLGMRLYPRSVMIIDTILLIVLMGGMRLSRRLWGELTRSAGAKRVLIVGAGDAGEMIVRDMKNDPASTYQPVGFVDDDRSKIGRRIHGVPVIGPTAGLADHLEGLKPEEVLIAMPGVDPAEVRRIVRSLQPSKIPIKTLPHLRDLIDGTVQLGQIRSLAVEDLLARAPVGLKREPLQSLIQGRRVLVTGAGGSIGSELCRQIALLEPCSLVMLDRYENGLHAIVNELVESPSAPALTALIGDVSDERRMDGVFVRYKPEIVFHAAAHKHVPLMEGNPAEAIKNNVRGTRIVAAAADRHAVNRFILISTDKAVNPTSVMGASKRVAELVLQVQAKGSGTSFASVRFGNVLGSNGSVIPRWVQQIRRGGPVTVTHPEMRRFFMLIPEAVQLVLHAAAQAEGGGTYVLEMGEQVKLVDMARDMIRLSGLLPEEDIAITFVGARPGEKLYEELVGADEEVQRSPVEKILRVTPRVPPRENLIDDVLLLETYADTGDEAAVLRQLTALVGSHAGPPKPEPAVPGVVAVPVPASERVAPCPRCDVGSIHRSRARGLRRIRRAVSTKRLYRCETCGWRGWILPIDYALRNDSLPPLASPNFDLLDGSTAPTTPTPRATFSPRDLQ